MDWESLLSDSIGAAPGLVSALNGNPAAPAAGTVTNTAANAPGSTTSLKPTVSAQVGGYIGWIIGGVAILVVAVVLWRRK